MGIRTLVVADPGEVSRNISDVICTHPEFELLANCGDSFEALQWMEETNPDLLLLDLELPGMDGFELLDALGSGAPEVIFLTNSSQHAVKAFDHDAIDLLGKPVSRERLHRALLRAKQHVSRPTVDQRIPLSQPKRILVRSGGRLVFLDPHDVQWMEANDNYVVFHAGNERHTVRMTMNALERSLDPNVFARIHRSTIVNLEYVRELRGLAHGDYAVVLRDGTELTLTRNYRHTIAALARPS
jgi:two-component system LytT family response regulator